MSWRRSCVRLGFAICVPFLLTLLVIRFAPFMANRDDFIRYYFGGYVGSVQIRGDEGSTVLRERLEDASSKLPTTHDKLRFEAAKTPYVPFFIATTPIGMAAFELTTGIHYSTWILGFHTLLWGLVILAAAIFIFRTARICSVFWFLAAGVAVAWLNGHTSPFLPAPRSVSTLAAGLALAWYLAEGNARYGLSLLVLGFLFHPYQHLMNVGVVLLFLVLIWSDQPLTLLKTWATWKMAAVAFLAALLGIAVIWFANAMSFPRFASMLGARAGYDIWNNWNVNRETFENSVRHLGPLLLVLVFLEKGWKKALACAVLFLAGLLSVSLLGHSGAYYPGEYVQRVAAMWTVIVFALLLKKDLFVKLKDSIETKSLWLEAGIVLLCLLFAWRSYGAWNPGVAWKRFIVPSEKEWGPVEAECFRILVLARQPGAAPTYNPLPQVPRR